MFMPPLLRPWSNIQFFHMLYPGRSVTLIIHMLRDELAIMDVSEPDFCIIENDE